MKQGISCNSLVASFFKKFNSSDHISNIESKIEASIKELFNVEKVILEYSLAKKEVSKGIREIIELIKKNGQAVMTVSVIESSRRSILSAPIFQDKKCIGVIFLDSQFSKNKFDENDLTLLELYSSAISILISKNILIKDNLELVNKLKDVIGDLKDIKEEFKDQISQYIHELEITRLELKMKYNIGNIVGSSEKIKELITQINNLTNSDMPVLISGESGSGKELVAKTIHYQGNYSNGPFILFDCKSTTPQTVKKELLGQKLEKGILEHSIGGTIYFKNIEYLDKQTQKQLVKIFKNKKFKKTGIKEEIAFNSRIIASTKDGRAKSIKSQFIPELFGLFNGAHIIVPPLRDRVEDIPLLCNYFLKEISEEQGEGLKFISGDALKLLVKYPWPNNISELANEIRRAAFLSDEKIEVKDISEKISHPSNLPGMILLSEIEGEPLDKAINLLERELVRTTLERAKGNKAKSAKMLGISRTTLYEILGEDGEE